MDILGSIIKLDNGYLAQGIRYKDGIYYDHVDNAQFIMIRLDENGDTLYSRLQEVYSRSSQPGHALKRSNDGNVFNAIYMVDPLTNSGYKLRLYKLKPDGTTIWFKDYDSTKTWHVENLCITADGGALILGSKNSLAPNFNTGYVIRVDSAGNELWRKTFQPSIVTYIRHVEILKGTRDNYLISGNAGQYIWAAWLDGQGNTLNSRYIYYDSSNTQLDVASVMQSPNGSLVVYSTNSSTQKSCYLGLYNSTGNINFYGKKELGGIDLAYVNSSGEILVEKWGTNGSIFRKYDQIMGIIDTCILTSSATNTKALFCAAWSDADSAVFAGWNQTDRRT